MNHQSLNEVIKEIEIKLISANIPIPVFRKAYIVIIEAVQNLFHHIEKTVTNRQFIDEVFFRLSHTNKHIYISTGNFILNENIRLLKDRIEQVNALEKDELKLLYREILGNEEFTKKGGGGLGLVEIARKTGYKLDYQFHPFNEEFSFLTFDIKISLNIKKNAKS